MEDDNYANSISKRKLWNIELDLLAQIKSICRRHNLKYFAAAGTLLGAARHKGFIPWDDDIDLFMLWDDYKRLCEIAPSEINYPYFFQCHNTDLYAVPDKARLRRSDTTGCTLWEYNNVYDGSCNRGIFIDIFPLFNLPDLEDEMILYKKEIVEIWKAVRGFIAFDGRLHGCNTYDADYNDYIEVFQKYNEHYTIEQLRCLYLERCGQNKDRTMNVGLSSFRLNSPRFVLKREWFDESIELPFEDTTINCPKQFDAMLTKEYGDWRIPVNTGALHEMHIVDFNTSYTENQELLSRLSQYLDL